MCVCVHVCVCVGGILEFLLVSLLPNSVGYLPSDFTLYNFTLNVLVLLKPTHFLSLPVSQSPWSRSRSSFPSSLMSRVLLHISNLKFLTSLSSFLPLCPGYSEEGIQTFPNRLLSDYSSCSSAFPHQISGTTTPTTSGAPRPYLYLLHHYL